MDRRERPRRLTIRELGVEGGKHAAALAVSGALWLAALGSFRFAWDADAWASIGQGLGVVAVIVLAGHVLPTVLRRQVSWLWSVLATTGVLAAWTALEAARAHEAAASAVAFGLLVVGVPVLALTLAVRTFVGPMRPTRALRTPITAELAHTPRTPTP